MYDYGVFAFGLAHAELDVGIRQEGLEVDIQYDTR